MAEETKTIVSSPSDYWISPHALSISLNALGEHDRIQASVASGAVIFCYYKDIEAFDFDAGHNFRKWPLVISPTYFNSTTAKYLYVAIPRSNTIGSEAMIVFPSQLLDIYGHAAIKRIVRDQQGNMLDPNGNITTDESKADYYYIAGDQVGSEDYYFIWLQGIITASGDNSANEREWSPEYETGKLNTDETWGDVVTLEDLMIALRAKVNTEWFSRLFILHGYKTSVVYKTDPETGEPLIDEETGEPIVDIDPETGQPKTVKEDVVIQPNAWPQDGDGITITDIESKYGLWTNFFLSALGKNDAGGGGGGGTDLFEPLLSINESGLGLPPQGLTGKVGIVWNYTTQRYEWGETGGGGGGEGSVTSIGLTAPTGFTVTGSPITSSGTLGLAFADGYSLPTTAKQTLWDEAYNKRHEHSNLNVLEGITSTKVTNWDTAFGWGNHAAAGYALTSNVYTKEQADAKYMTIAAFERLFNPLDSNDQKVSHPYSSGVASIKALFGLWTEQYLSALGKNDSGGGSVVLNGPLEEINNTVFQTTHPTSAWQTIVWNGSAWVYGNAGASSVDWSNITNKPSTFTPSAHTHAWSDITSGVPDFATKDWIGQNYISIAFFNRIFQAYKSSTISGENKLIPNDVTSAINNLKILVGAWTDQYLSALGKNDDGGGGGSSSLADLVDVQLTTPVSDGQALIYDSSTSKWVNGAAGIDMTALTSYLSSKILTIKNGNNTLGTWNPTGVGAIDISSAISGYLPLTGGTLTGALTINGINHQNLIVNSSAVTSNVAWTGVQFNHTVNDNNVMYGGLCMNEQDGSFYRYDHSYNQYKIWDEGNDGSGSGLDADLLDGQHASYFAPLSELSNYVTLATAQTITGVKTFTTQQIFTNGIKIGQYEIVPDTQNGGLHVKGGLYTDTFLSALGLNNSGGSASTLSDLVDVQLTTPVSNGQALIYNSTLGMWVNGAAGMNVSELETYLSSKILTIKNGTASLGTWNPTAAGLIDIASALGGYLPLTGGTLSLSGIGTFTVKNAVSDYPLIRFEGKDAGGLGFIGVNAQKQPVFVTVDNNGGYTEGVSQWNTLLHTGNWTSTINLTSLGAASSSYFTNGVANQAARLSGTSSYTVWGRTYWQNGVPQNASGNIDLSKGDYIVLKESSNEYSLFGVSADNTLLVGWGLKSISGSNTTIAAGNTLSIGYGYDVNDTTYGKFWTVFRDNGHVTINAVDSSNVFLNVGGATKTTRLYLYKPNSSNDTNAVYLEYNSTNAGVHLVGGGIYADTYVSALGLSDQGSGVELNALLDSLNNSGLSAHGLANTTVVWDGSQWTFGTTGLDQTALTNYLSTKILTIKNGTTSLGTWNPTAAGTIDIAAAIGSYLPITGGTLALNGIGAFTVKNTASDYPLIRFEGKNAGGLGFIGVNAQKQPVFVTVDNNGGYTDGVSQWEALLHTGNWTSTINLTSLGAASSSYFTNGVANSALRLNGTSSYTAWGQTYWSSGVPSSISGNMTNVGNITPSASGKNIGARNNYFNDIYGQSLCLVDSQTDEDFNIIWYTVNSKRVVAMYAWETKLSDIIIGTTDPNYAMYYDSTNIRWGINTGTPSYTLDVNGVARATRLISNSSDGDSLWLISSSTYNCIRFDLGTTFKWSFGCNADEFYWYGSTAGYALSLLNNGNFGIGTYSPSYKLHVVGSIFGNSLSTNENLSSVSGGYISGFYGIDFRGVSGTGAHGGFLDFHYSNTSNDYSSRFIETDYGLMKLMSKNASGGNQRSALVVGEGYDTSYVQIGDIRLVYNYNNNALRVVRYDGSAANFYATGGISALGISGDASGSVSSSLLPSVSGEYDLGSTSYKWRNLYLYNGGAFSIVPGSSAISLNSNKKIVFTSDIEINDESSLYVDNRICIGSSNSSYAFYVSGNSYLTGSISASNVINRSDMRLKDFVKNTDLRVESIAEAPSFKFTFKDGDSRLRVGTSAQYWRGVLPESVFSDADGMLGLDYGVTALVSVISVARKVMTHEERIAALEAENERLRNEIKTLKAA